MTHLPHIAEEKRCICVMSLIFVFFCLLISRLTCTFGAVFIPRLQSMVSLSHKIPYLTQTDTPKIQYPKEVEVRVKSFGETRCINQKKPKTKIKNGGSEEVQREVA